jgi:hypothetical protein
MLKDVSAWLIINTMKMEKVQFNMLCQQSISNVWRKKCFKLLTDNHGEIGSEKCAEILMKVWALSALHLTCF